jgi:nicotinamide phosphoribosyltransferase
MKLFAPHQIDAYKTGHKDQYPKGTQIVYSNLTARNGYHSNIKNSKGVVFFGLQYFIKSYLIDEWNKTFFNKPKKKVLAKYQERMKGVLGKDVNVQHISDLHDLGFLPISIKAHREGSFIPYQIPLLTIENTHKDFYWITNYLETVMCNELWPLINTATTARSYLKTFKEFSDKTSDNKDFVYYQGHDFSCRGMFGRHAAAMSGMAHLTCFDGTDTIAAIDLTEKYYIRLVGSSVPATEHSCMAASINTIQENSFLGFDRSQSEEQYFKDLITKIYPDGPVSIVSDTYDFWNVITNILPSLKQEIMNRNGKVIIRPDSGDPVRILTGDPLSNVVYERQGLIECLWNIFGGTINSKGYKELDPHIGAIYGDSITLERQEQILQKLKDKGFSSTNVVLGIGSYSYQGTTRDTHSLAMKATWCMVNNKGIDIYKSPKTDSNKSSAKGLLMVTKVGESQYELKDECTRKEEERGCLQEVFLNGRLMLETDLLDVRYFIGKELTLF